MKSASVKISVSVKMRSAIRCTTLPSARVVKLVDTRDLKSLARKRVPVRLRLRAPIKSIAYKFVGYFFVKNFRCTVVAQKLD